LVIALLIVVILAIIAFCSPVQIVVMGTMLVDHPGLHPALTVLLILLCSFIGLVAYAIVLLPLTNSLDVECDPEKHLMLNVMLNKTGNIDHIYAVDYFALGDYRRALEYANKMIKTKREDMILAGLFNKARCEFMLGEGEALRQTAEAYSCALMGARNLKGKTLTAYQGIRDVVELMCALSEENVERIRSLADSVAPWGPSKANECFIDYLKGVAACKTDDIVEVIYRFKTIKEKCPKTVFARLAERELERLTN